MKSFHLPTITITTLFLSLSLVCSGGALAGTTPKTTKRTTTTPTPPSLSYLGTVNIDLAPPIEVGVGPLGDRNIFAIEGGTFAGPIFNASIPPFGGDWGLGHPANLNFYVDARYQLRTADGANIYVEANGPQQPESGLVHTRVKFETGHPAYYWLNRVVATGIVSPGEGIAGIVIDLWKVETPASSS